MSTPKVSVVMPVYNGERYLRAAIDSILRQTYTDFELVIINDGSTDRSREIALSFDDHRVRLIDNPSNTGLVNARNLGLDEARGEYVALLDSDDVAEPTRLAQQLDCFSANHGLGVLGSWMVLIDPQGRPLAESWKPRFSMSATGPTMLFRNCMINSSAMFPRKMANRIRYRAEFPLAEDYDFFVRLSNQAPIWNLPRVLVRYRQHPASISQQQSDRMEQCVRGIVTGQLSALGVSPSSAELEIHRRLGGWDGGARRETFAAAEAWLLRLQAANRSMRRYPPEHFDGVLGERWYYLCNLSIELGPWIVDRFRRSPLASLYAHRWRGPLTLLAKSLRRTVIRR